MIVIKSFNLDNISYLPLYSPLTSYRIEIINPTTVKMTLRSNPVDSDTELDVFPGESRVFETSRNTFPFDSKTPVIYAILASGTGKAKVIAY